MNNNTIIKFLFFLILETLKKKQGGGLGVMVIGAENSWWDKFKFYHGAVCVYFVLMFFFFFFFWKRHESTFPLFRCIITGNYCKRRKPLDTKWGEKVTGNHSTKNNYDNVQFTDKGSSYRLNSNTNVLQGWLWH